MKKIINSLFITSICFCTSIFAGQVTGKLISVDKIYYDPNKLTIEYVMVKLNGTPTELGACARTNPQFIFNPNTPAGADMLSLLALNPAASFSIIGTGLCDVLGDFESISTIQIN